VLLKDTNSFVPLGLNEADTIGLYHSLDGITNLKYKLLYFLTPNKKISKRKALAFNRDRGCHLALCLRLILFHEVHFNADLFKHMTINLYMNGWIDAVLDFLKSWPILHRLYF
jgi:hypothetical protein